MTQPPEFKVESGVPLPKAHANSKYPFTVMEVGESFFVPAKLVGKIRVAAGNYSARKGTKFSVRKIDGGYRCWRVE